MKHERDHMLWIQFGEILATTEGTFTFYDILLAVGREIKANVSRSPDSKSHVCLSAAQTDVRMSDEEPALIPQQSHVDVQRRENCGS